MKPFTTHRGLVATMDRAKPSVAGAWRNARHGRPYCSISSSAYGSPGAVSAAIAWCRFMCSAGSVFPRVSLLKLSRGSSHKGDNA